MFGEQEYGGSAHTTGTADDQYLGFVGIPKPPVSCTMPLARLPPAGESLVVHVAMR